VFPVDLFGRIANEVLKKLVDGGVSRAISRSGDSQQRFGRDLFAFYEGLEDYAETASHLQVVIERIDLSDPPGNSLDTNIDWANRLSNELSATVAGLMESLWPPGVEYDEAAEEILHGEPSKRAMRRGKVMGVLDPKLVELAKTTLALDLNAIGLAQYLNAIYFDLDHLEIATVLPANGDLTVILREMQALGFSFRSVGELLGPPEEPIALLPPGAATRISLASESEQIDNLVALLGENVDSVRALRNRVGTALRQHFTLEDLL
jgi:hypothetical protein